MSDNPLVDKNAHFKPDDYFPDRDQTDKGDYHTLNPITSGGDWLSGTGPWADAEQWAKDAKSNDGSVLDEFQVCLDSLGLSMDVVGTLVDPLGTAASMLAGWLMDHLKIFRLLLDELAGNPGTVQGVSQTWANISTAIGKAQQAYIGAVNSDIAQWRGDAADAYRQTANTLAQAMGGCAALADGMSAIVACGGQLVSSVRSAVRDILANLIGELVSDSIQEACTGGAATPVVMAEALGLITRESRTAIKLIEDVLELLGKILTWVGRAMQLLNLILSVLPELERALKDGTKAVPAVTA